MKNSIWYNVNVIISVINGKGISSSLNVDGKTLSSFKSGGIVRALVFPKNESELVTTIRLIRTYNVPYFILGNGTNTLIPDKGFNGIFVSLKKLNSVEFDGNNVTAGAGVSILRLYAQAMNLSLSGLERFAGIPGTIGGATIKNAGCFGADLSPLVQQVEGIDKVHLTNVVLEKSQLNFSYRSSNDSFSNLIITKVKLQLTPEDQNHIKRLKQEYSLKRKLLQPSAPSLGSVFLKPDLDLSAGYYIEKAGLKGARIGGAEISSKHANFIINNGNATSGDYLSLVELAQSVVKNKFDVSLKPEIDIIGEVQIEY